MRPDWYVKSGAVLKDLKKNWLLALITAIVALLYWLTPPR